MGCRTGSAIRLTGVTPQVRPDNAVALADQAILELLAYLRETSYRFVTPNRGVHAWVRQREHASSEDLLRDVFGWLRPVEPGGLPQRLEKALLDADLLCAGGDRLSSCIRVSSVGDLLFVHSAPEAGRDAVFLGPDSYRYARFLRQALSGLTPAARALDIGVGAGVGALTLLADGLAREVTGVDVNPEALRLARLNALHADLPLKTEYGSGVPIEGEGYDLIVANPPFIAGDNGATYRDGGDSYGSRLALEWSKASLDRLKEGGRFVLYTGAPVVRGVDLVRDGLAQQAQGAGMVLTYDEIDPDIFGSLIRTKAYRDVERIAAIGAVISRP